MMQWNGKKFVQVTDWEEPLDPAYIRQLVEASAGKFAQENNIQLKQCPCPRMIAALSPKNSESPEGGGNQQC